jgi:hypothetical protein
MFAAWGEMLAYKLEVILDENQFNKDEILNVKDYFNESKHFISINFSIKLMHFFIKFIF